MVRLKVIAVILLSIYSFISIPYGAIKRTNPPKNHCTSGMISIPYGAIKS